jgi:hypothetical protein
MNTKFLPLILTLLLATACSEQKEQEKAPSEPKQSIEQESGDEKLTEELGQKLLNANKIIGLQQESNQEALNKANLEKLSEEDRQAIIDLTIEEGAENIKVDANKMMSDLEKQTRENAEHR